MILEPSDLTVIAKSKHYNSIWVEKIKECILSGFAKDSDTAAAGHIIEELGNWYGDQHYRHVFILPENSSTGDFIWKGNYAYLVFSFSYDGTKYLVGTVKTRG